MQTATEYLAKTESAVRHLFDGIAVYDNLLRSAVIPVPAMDESIATASGSSQPSRSFRHDLTGQI